MDTSTHSLNNLFAQMGLASTDDAISAYAHQHRLRSDVLLHRAECWTPSQAQFIRDAMREDSDWASAVDQLNALMRCS
ncbi:MAG: DUF2789 domain-containing protein [Pseudomonadota bacterium]